jgi:hypothetical protein
MRLSQQQLRPTNTSGANGKGISQPRYNDNNNNYSNNSSNYNSRDNSQYTSRNPSRTHSRTSSNNSSVNGDPVSAGPVFMAHLSEEEFLSVFEVSRSQWSRLPQWQQGQRRKLAGVGASV